MLPHASNLDMLLHGWRDRCVTIPLLEAPVAISLAVLRLCAVMIHIPLLHRGGPSVCRVRSSLERRILPFRMIWPILPMLFVLILSHLQLWHWICLPGLPHHIFRDNQCLGFEGCAGVRWGLFCQQSEPSIWFLDMQFLASVAFLCSVPFSLRDSVTFMSTKRRIR